MIDSYFVNTPNGRKVSIMLAETALPHRLIRGDRGEVDHLSKEFRQINPNARLPAIVDHDPLGGGQPFPVFESGAILIYLADKTGRFLSQEPRKRHTQLQWLIWQMAGLGPMHGQAHHFARYAPEPVDPDKPLHRNRGVNDEVRHSRPSRISSSVNDGTGPFVMPRMRVAAATFSSAVSAAASDRISRNSYCVEQFHDWPLRP